MESLGDVIERQKQEALRSQFPSCARQIDISYECEKFQRRKRYADGKACEYEEREMTWCILSTWCPVKAKAFRDCLPARKLLAGNDSVPKQCKSQWKEFDECLISFQIDDKK